MVAPVTALRRPAHLAEVPGPQPTGIRDLEPGSYSWAGLPGPLQNDVTARVCWLLAAPAPITWKGQLRPLTPPGPKCKFIWTAPAQTSMFKRHLLQEGCLDAPRLIGVSYELPTSPGLPPLQSSPQRLVTRLSPQSPRGPGRFGGCSPGVGSGAGERWREVGGALSPRACAVTSGGRPPHHGPTAPCGTQMSTGAGWQGRSCRWHPLGLSFRGQLRDPHSHADGGVQMRGGPTDPTGPLQSFELQGGPASPETPKGS